jgi:hypothetical protein
MLSSQDAPSISVSNSGISLAEYPIIFKRKAIATPKGWPRKNAIARELTMVRGPISISEWVRSTGEIELLALV